jgi:high affinity Mn2+ porin
VAAIVNDISGSRQGYLNAGGLGILIGDGKLPHPGTERIFETYYNFATLDQHLHLTLDYQWVGNPAYNQDRGPVSIFTFRFHVQF